MIESDSPSQSSSSNPQLFDPSGGLVWDSLSPDTDVRSPHSTGSNGRSPHGTGTNGQSPHAPAEPLLAYDGAYIESFPGHRYYMQEMGNNLLLESNNPSQGPTYTHYPISDGTSNVLYQNTLHTHSYLPPPLPKPYPVFQRSGEPFQQSHSTLVNPQDPSQFQAVEYTPDATESYKLEYNPDATGPYKQQVDNVNAPTAGMYAPGRGKRKLFWGCCVFVVLLAIILGCVFGIVLKDKDHSLPSNSASNAGSRTSTTSSTSTTRAPTSITTVTSSATTTAASSPAPAPTTTTTTDDPFKCMNNCRDTFNGCLNECDSTWRTCKGKCGGDLFCESPCGFSYSDCNGLCHAAQRSCKC